MTSLLDLPAEVLGLILAETTPAAFIQIAYSCSALLMLAANDCLLLLYHLRQIPEVIDSEWDNLDASRLFRLLCRKALLSLVPGFQVEEREFTFDNGMFNAHISKFFERNGILSLALASKTSDRVTVYDLGADQPRLLRMLDAPCDARTSVHALCMAVSAGGDTIYVLQDCCLTEDDCCDSSEPKDDSQFSIVASSVDDGQRTWRSFPSSPGQGL